MVPEFLLLAWQIIVDSHHPGELRNIETKKPLQNWSGFNSVVIKLL